MPGPLDPLFMKGPQEDARLLSSCGINARRLDIRTAIAGAERSVLQSQVNGSENYHRMSEYAEPRKPLISYQRL